MKQQLKSLIGLVTTWWDASCVFCRGARIIIIKTAVFLFYLAVIYGAVVIVVLVYDHGNVLRVYGGRINNSDEINPTLAAGSKMLLTFDVEKLRTCPGKATGSFGLGCGYLDVRSAPTHLHEGRQPVTVEYPVPDMPDGTVCSVEIQAQYWCNPWDYIEPEITHFPTLYFTVKNTGRNNGGEIYNGR